VNLDPRYIRSNAPHRETEGSKSGFLQRVVQTVGSSSAVGARMLRKPQLSCGGTNSSNPSSSSGESANFRSLAFSTAAHWPGARLSHSPPPPGGILGKLRHGTQQLRHADEVAGRSRERELSNIVADPATAKAAIVDCVLDFN
jgi:hypothetical protein